MKSPLIVFSALLLSTFILQPAAFPQGSLTPPPGTPAPTMKTLDQVDTHIDVKGEKRIDLQSAPAAAVTTTDANYHFIINQAGSYYLSANLGVTKTNGIQIAADGVTLDLNGFQISRISGSTGTGIQAIGTVPNNCTIKNGSVQGFTFGISGNGARGGRISFINVSTCGFGIDVVADGWGVDHCNAHDNNSAGIIVGNGCTVSQCTATNNGGSGIGTGDGSTVVDCSAYGNRTSYGISMGIGCTVVNCTANGNTSASSASYGIFTAGGSTIIGCTAQGNTNTNATPSSLTGVGIYGSVGSTVKNCTTIANKGDGLHLEDKCSVSGCTSNQSAFGFGINGGNALAVSDSTVAENKSGGINGANGCTIKSVTAYKNHGIAAINVADGSTVTGCTVRENDQDGIKVTTGTIVSNNEVDFNGITVAGGASAGIHVTGSSVRVEGNNATGNFNNGIKVDGTPNTIFHNSIHTNGNGAAYTIAGGNDAGPIGSAATSTSPFANISY